mmetsp:Transcript_39442/g.104265  ORF Transcript_39442/g.104265 Transcript_39442/m.104265 type:complete len:394 (+) Transcript_39442:898-2079(+)
MLGGVVLLAPVLPLPICPRMAYGREVRDRLLEERRAAGLRHHHPCAQPPGVPPEGISVLLEAALSLRRRVEVVGEHRAVRLGVPSGRVAEADGVGVVPGDRREEDQSLAVDLPNVPHHPVVRGLQALLVCPSRDHQQWVLKDVARERLVDQLEAEDVGQTLHCNGRPRPERSPGVRQVIFCVQGLKGVTRSVCPMAACPAMKEGVCREHCAARGAGREAVLARVCRQGPEGHREAERLVIWDFRSPWRDSLTAEPLREQVLMHVEQNVDAVGGGLLNDTSELLEVSLVVLPPLWLCAGPHDPEADEVDPSLPHGFKVLRHQRDQRVVRVPLGEPRWPLDDDVRAVEDARAPICAGCCLHEDSVTRAILQQPQGYPRQLRGCPGWPMWRRQGPI